MPPLAPDILRGAAAKYANGKKEMGGIKLNLEMRTELRQYVLGREMEGFPDHLSQFYIARTLGTYYFFRLGNGCVSPNGVTCVENELKQRLAR